MKKEHFHNALKIFIFLSPIFTFQDYNVPMARGLFFLFGTFFLFGLTLGIESKRNFSNFWASLIFLLGFIRVFFDNLNDPNQFINFWFACSSFIYLFAGILLFKTIYCYAENIKQYIYPILFVCLLNLVLSVCQHFGYDFMWFYFNHTNGSCGFMETSTQLGQYSAMAIPLLYVLNPFLIIIPLISLFLSGSSTPIISLFVGLLFFCWQTKRKAVTIFISICSCILLAVNLSYIEKKFYNRPIMWKKTASMALKKPFLGWGYQSFNKRVNNNKYRAGITVEQTAYNDYLHSAQEIGFPIVIAFLMFLFGMFKKFSIMDKDILSVCLVSSVIIVLVNMCGQSLIRFASISNTFIIVLALLYAYIDERINYDQCPNS